MDLKGHSIVYGISSIVSALTGGWLLMEDKGEATKEAPYQFLTKVIPVKDESEKGMVNKEEVIKECGDKEECKEIAEWSSNNGQCNIYLLPTNTKEYGLWYKLEAKKGLIMEIKRDKEKYSGLCKDMKSLWFHYDEEHSTWVYDGAGKYSRS